MNTKKDQLLGEEQWRWLKESLYESNADLIIIASSISVLSPVSRFLFWIEGWHQFKREKTKLVEFIDTLNKKLILISGDRHYSDVSRVPLRNRRFLYEFMSSGMSKTSRPMSSHLRINSPISILNFSTLEIKKDFNGVIDINHQINTVITGRLIQRNIIKI